MVNRIPRCMRQEGLLLFFLLFSTAVVCSGEVSLDGDWVGVLSSGQESVPLRIHFEKATGTISAPTYGIFQEPITKIEVYGTSVRFSLQKESVLLEFDGARNGNEIVGYSKIKSEKATFEMMHLVSVDTAKYFGVYELEPQKHVYVRTWDELGENQLTYFDDAGNVGALYPVSSTSFVSGPGIWIPFPTKVKVEFDADFRAMNWSEKELPKKKARRVALCKEEEVTFRDADVSLAGSLVTPAHSGPFPAVVLVHGSGPVTRDFFGPIAYVLASRGIAVLSYDKRGNGQSSGDWLEANFEDLAADAVAGVQFLKSRKEINPERIGLLGISQGGWIIPIAASNSSDVNFAVLISSPAVKPIEQEVQSVKEEMLLSGATKKQIDAAVTKLLSDIDSLRSEETIKWLKGEVQKLKEEGKNDLLAANGPDNPRFLLWYPRVMDFNPAPFLEKMKCPVLALYGEADRGVPVRENKEKLENILSKRKDKNYTIRVFPQGNHALMLAKTGAREEFFHLNRFVPDFFNVVSQWILNNSKN